MLTIENRTVALICGFRRLALVAGSFVLTAVVLTGDVGNPTTAPGVADAEQLDAAIQDTLDTVTKSRGTMQNQAVLKDLVTAAFPLLHPALAVQLRREDPAFAAGEDTELAALMDPAKVHEERMKDPENARRFAEMVAGLERLNSEIRSQGR